jgi:hypothetical protein
MRDFYSARRQQAAAKLEALEARHVADDRAVTTAHTDEQIAHRAAVAEHFARRVVETRGDYEGVVRVLRDWTATAVCLPDHAVKGPAAASLIDNLMALVDRKGAELQAGFERDIHAKVQQLADELNEHFGQLNEEIAAHVEGAVQNLRVELRTKKAKVIP